MDPSKKDRHYANIQGSNVGVMCFMHLIQEGSRISAHTPKLAASKKAVYAYSPY